MASAEYNTKKIISFMHYNYVLTCLSPPDEAAVSGLRGVLYVDTVAPLRAPGTALGDRPRSPPPICVVWLMARIRKLMWLLKYFELQKSPLCSTFYVNARNPTIIVCWIRPSQARPATAAAGSPPWPRSRWRGRRCSFP